MLKGHLKRHFNKIRTIKLKKHHYVLGGFGIAAITILASIFGFQNIGTYAQDTQTPTSIICEWQGEKIMVESGNAGTIQLTCDTENLPILNLREIINIIPNENVISTGIITIEDESTLLPSNTTFNLNFTGINSGNIELTINGQLESGGEIYTISNENNNTGNIEVYYTQSPQTGPDCKVTATPENVIIGQGGTITVECSGENMTTQDLDFAIQTNEKINVEEYPSQTNIGDENITLEYQFTGAQAGTSYVLLQENIISANGTRNELITGNDVEVTDNTPIEPIECTIQSSPDTVDVDETGKIIVTCETSSNLNDYLYSTDLEYEIDYISIEERALGTYKNGNYQYILSYTGEDTIEQSILKLKEGVLSDGVSTNAEAEYIPGITVKAITPIEPIECTIQASPDTVDVDETGKIIVTCETNSNLNDYLYSTDLEYEIDYISIEERAPGIYKNGNYQYTLSYIGEDEIEQSILKLKEGVLSDGVSTNAEAEYTPGITVKAITPQSDPDFTVTAVPESVIKSQSVTPIEPIAGITISEYTTPDCLSGWNNDYFLTPEFWKMNPSTGNIVCALYGSGEGDQTAYTMGWENYEPGVSCNELTVEITGNLENNLSPNTIYVLTSTGFEISTQLDLPSCTAIISNQTGGKDTTITFIGTTSGIIINGGYGIIENISLNGKNNNEGISITTGSNTLNVVKIYNWETGINVMGAYNLLNNIQSFANNKGINIGSERNAINNSQLYNNSIGLEVGENATGNKVYNVEIYQNKTGLYVAGTNNEFEDIEAYGENNETYPEIYEKYKNYVYIKSGTNNSATGKLQQYRIQHFIEGSGENGNIKWKSEISGFDRVYSEANGGSAYIIQRTTGMLEMPDEISPIYSGYDYPDYITNPQINDNYYMFVWSSRLTAPNQITTNITRYSYGYEINTQKDVKLRDDNTGGLVTGNYFIGSNVQKYEIEGTWTSHTKLHYSLTGKNTDSNNMIKKYDILTTLSPTITGTITGYDGPNWTKYYGYNITNTLTGITINSGVELFVQTGDLNSYPITVQMYGEDYFAEHRYVTPLTRSRPRLTIEPNEDKCVHKETINMTGTWSSYSYEYDITGFDYNNINVTENAKFNTGTFTGSSTGVYTRQVELTGGTGKINISGNTAEDILEFTGTYKNTNYSYTYYRDIYGPNISTTGFSVDECTEINLDVTADDEGCAGISGYKLEGALGNIGRQSSSGFQISAETIGRTGGTKTGLIYVIDKFGNTREKIITGIINDIPLTLSTGNIDLGTITGEVTRNITDDMGPTAGICETITTNITGIENATYNLEGNQLTITPKANYNGTGSCTIEFTDGDTTKTGTYEFTVNTITSGLILSLNPAGSDEWTGNEVEVTMTGENASGAHYLLTGAIGVDFGTCRNSGTSLNQSGTETTFTGEITINSTGINYLYLCGESLTGEQIIKSGVYKIDNTGPTGDVEYINGNGGTGNSCTTGTVTIKLVTGESVSRYPEEPFARNSTGTWTGVNTRTVSVNESGTGYIRDNAGHIIVLPYNVTGIVSEGPTTPILNNPGSGDTLASSNTGFSWTESQASGCATLNGYTMYIKSGDEIVRSGTTGGTSINPGDLSNGTYSRYVVAIDNFDQTAQSQEETFYINANMPECTITYVPASGSWTNQNVTGIITCSGITVTDNTYLYTGNQTHEFEVIDSGNNTWIFSGEVTWIDKDSPECNIQSNVPGNGQATLTLSFSGEAHPDNSGYSRDGSNYSNNNQKIVTSDGTYTGYVKDLAGNTGSCTTTINNINTTAPIVSATNSSTSRKSGNINITMYATGINLSGSKYITGTSTNTFNQCRSSGSGYDSGYTLNRETEGIGYLTLCAYDQAGNTGYWTGIYKLDKTTPSCSISKSTSSQTSGNVTLSVSITETNPDKYSWTGWNSLVSTTGTWTMTGNGTKTFYVQDIAGNTGTCSTGVDNIDKDAPTGGSFSINNGAEYTTTTGVTLNTVCPTDAGEGTVQVAYGNNHNPTNWMNCSGELQHTLTDGSGEKTVYMRFRDGLGNTTNEISDTITLNTSAISVSANNSNVWKTGNIQITLSVSAGALITYSKYSWTGASNCISNGQNFSSGDTITYSTEGVKTLYLCAKDESNQTASWSGVYKLDKTNPSCSISKSTSSRTSGNVILSVNVTETNPDKYSWTGWDNLVNTTGTWTMSSNGDKTFYVQDIAGNTGTCSTGVNNIDKTAPNGEIITTYPSGKLTNGCTSGSVTLTLSGTDTNGLHTTPYKRNNEAWTGNATITLTNNGQGTGYIRDVAGNITEISYNITGISVSGPDISLNTPHSGTILTGFVHFVWNRRTSNPTCQAISGGYNIVVYSGTDEVYTGKTNNTSIETSLSDGTYTWKVYAKDILGHTSTSQTRTLIINSQAPTCDIEYIPGSGAKTSGDVLAILTGCTLGATGFNATGHTFTGNTTYEFTFISELGITGNAIADVTRIDKDGPVLAEVTPIGTTTDTTPDYTFSSNESGTIAYSGACSSTKTGAISGNNTITLNQLSAGTYSGCTITVTDELGNVSNKLTISEFTIRSQGGGGGRTLRKDNCPDGDYSDSYYDGTCQGSHNSDRTRDICKVDESHYTDEIKLAYIYSYVYGMTTMCPISEAKIYGYLRRDHLAKILSQYAINVLDLEPEEGKSGCTAYNDIANESEEMKYYIKTACELGLMGLEANGDTPMKSFYPNGLVSRAEFGTTLSRLIYGDAYNLESEAENTHPGAWYEKHLEALRRDGIMTKIYGDRPQHNELRGYVMLMIMRHGKSRLDNVKDSDVNSSSEIIELYKKNKELTCEISYYESEDEYGSGMIYIKDNKLRENFNIYNKGSISSLIKNNKLYIRGNALGTGIGMVADAESTALEELESLLEDEIYTFKNCNEAVKNNNVFETPSNIRFKLIGDWFNELANSLGSRFE